jgi:hypothetical protein
MTDSNGLKEKEVAFYTANLEAWFETRFEHDKSLLTLSAGAIGLLLTLISTVGVNSIESLILHILALFSFITCLASLLAIFKLNSAHLENVVKGKLESDPVLGFLDKTAIFTFMAGVIFSSIIGISTAVTKYTEKEKAMSEEQQSNPSLIPNSLDGAAKMAPIVTPSEGASVTGISNMAPTQPPAGSGSQSSGGKSE